MKLFPAIVFSLLLVSAPFYSQSKEDWLRESKAAQQKLNETFTNPETTVLLPEDFKDFTGLEFYPVSEKFIVEAEFIRTPDEKPFLMPTNTARTPEYVKFAEAHFRINDSSFVLNIFKNVEISALPEYEDYLFLPFTDLTSGDGTYGGGRYMDLRTPEGNRIILDFNKAYNPYCVYNPGYSCPIPPKENDLPIRIEAGVKDFQPVY